jgi:hypothetical protein
MRFNLSTRAVLAVLILAGLLLLCCVPTASARRIVALGDIHGDVEQLRAALVMAELVDRDTLHWIGGPNDKLVQVGDMLDRGPHDKAVLDAMMRWQREATAAGSEMVVLMGNHELMNIRGEDHYVHKEATASYGGKSGHRRAFAPDGEYGAFVRGLPLTHVDMGTLFVHAGLLPEYARRGLDAIETAAKEEIRRGDEGGRRHARDDVLGVDGPVWTRRLVHRAEHGDCRLVRETLDVLKLERIVVGHTPQPSGVVADLCDSRLLVVDVGMSKWMYGNLAMLELTQSNATAEVEIREILPHTKVAEEQKTAAVPDSATDKDTLEHELKRDNVRLQHIFETVRQAAGWQDLKPASDDISGAANGDL